MTKIFTDLLFATTLLTITTAANAEFVPTEIVATDTLVADQSQNDKTYAISFGYSAVLANGQAIVGAGAGAAVNATKGSHTVYVYDINENGETSLAQKIVEPEAANFFGWTTAANDKYLVTYATGTKKVYIYAKQDDGSWTSDTIASINTASINTAKTINGLDVDGDRIAVVENDYICVERITKSAEGVYSLEKELIAEGDWKVEGENAINIKPDAGVAIKGNVFVANKRGDGIYIFEYTELGWAQTNKVSNTNLTANRFSSIAINDKYISVASGSNNFLVIEKGSEGWSDATYTSVETKYIKKTATTAINGNFIVVTETNGTATSTGDYYAEFYTKVEGEWTLVKYAAQLNVAAGIAMDCAFDGKFYLASNQNTRVNGVNNVGKAYLYSFITNLEYTASEAQSVEENFEEQSPSNVIDIAKEYNATVTYSTSADGEYTEEIPSFVEPGTYTIYYKIEAEGYNTATGSVSFTINEKPSVVTAAVETISNDIRVYTIGRNIVVENAEGKSINIYNITGTSVYAATSINSKEVINSSKSGIYIIEVDGTAYKVVVK